MIPRSWAVLACIVLTIAAPRASAFETTQFESPHVHPVDLAPDGSRLFVVNTDDHHLSVFDLTGPDPVLVDEIPVGLEPVTVRARTATEVWVVSHLSDAVDVVDVGTGHVVQTLLPGDEPTDVVFAGGRAFVCVSQEDRIVVYDLDDLELDPVSVPLEMSDPRSLAVSPDGTTVYVAALDGQNRTTIVPTEVVAAGGGAPPPSPPMDGDLPPAPDTGLIVRHDGSSWVDEIGRVWDAALPYTLGDVDVVAIDAATAAIVDVFTGVGTSLFNLGVHPTDGRIVVTNLEARNEVRFEPNLRGNFIRNRITSIDPGTGVVTPHHLDPHIDYAVPEGSDVERAMSLALPMGVVVAPDGTAYVAAFGSGRVGVVDLDGVVLDRIDVGAGPSGLALDVARDRLYVVNRLAASLSVIDLETTSVEESPLGFHATPDAITEGRAIFYDASLGSGHGDASCASCHLFTGMDNLAWDLGDPGGEFVPNGANGFHPMKGPMTTQSLKELEGTNPFHWRGDKESLVDFNAAFVSLMGRAAEIPAPDFEAMEAFLFSVRYPPNPFQNLDGSFADPATGPSAQRGFEDFENASLVGSIDCVDCHQLPTGETDLVVPAQLLQDTQDFVVPQLRNMYEKTRFDRTASVTVRGFGYTKDGAVDDLFEFLEFPGFDFADDAQQEDQVAFMLAFNFTTPAALGARWTMDGTNEAEGLPRLDVLRTVAEQGDVGLIAKAHTLADGPRGYAYVSPDTWISDREAEPPLTTADLLAQADTGTEVTFTAVLTGAETRLGVDRDLDGYRDRDERDAGSDPADPASTPDALTVGGVGLTRPTVALAPIAPNPVRSGTIALQYHTSGDARVRVRIHDVGGRTVWSADVRGGDPRGVVSWDLTDDHGRMVPGGVYFVTLDAGGRTATRRVSVVR